MTTLSAPRGRSPFTHHLHGPTTNTMCSSSRSSTHSQTSRYKHRRRSLTRHHYCRDSMAEISRSRTYYTKHNRKKKYSGSSIKPADATNNHYSYPMRSPCSPKFLNEPFQPAQYVPPRKKRNQQHNSSRKKQGNPLSPPSPVLTPLLSSNSSESHFAPTPITIIAQPPPLLPSPPSPSKNMPISFDKIETHNKKFANEDSDSDIYINTNNLDNQLINPHINNRRTQNIRSPPNRFVDRNNGPYTNIPVNDDSPVALTDRIRALMGVPENQEHDDMIPEMLVPTVFNWSHGGRRVYLVTNLDGWQTKHQMSRSTADFSKILDLPCRPVQYRFEVDGQLLCDPEQKHVLASDGGYVNEIYVETTCHASFQNQENSIGKFTQHMPDPDDYVREPPTAPAHLKQILLNHQPPKGRNPVSLPNPSHVVLSHVYVAERKSSDVVVLGITQRFQQKTFTTVYYKHVDSIENLPPSVDKNAQNKSENPYTDSFNENFINYF